MLYSSIELSQKTVSTTYMKDYIYKRYTTVTIFSMMATF